MPTIHVCPLSCLHNTVQDLNAGHVVTLLAPGSTIARPQRVEPDRHLILLMSDIVEPMEGHVLPSREHADQLLTFVRSWDRGQPLVFHCWAGISRSTAAAFITACALYPEKSESSFAGTLRAASPTATPNRRLVAVADDILGRGGRMVDAIDKIGRGIEAAEGKPFLFRFY